ncbi:MAG: hemolysin family protein [Candidatus Wallbacteria bacterium]|nr:hemolysin family protein [Candidatus Wallbacteria bacterium]
MDSNDPVFIYSACFLILLFLSACFSASETALFSLSKFKLKLLEDQKNLGSRLILKLLSRPKHLLITILTANTIVNIGMATMASNFFIGLSHEYKLSESLILAIGTICLTLVVVLIGEVTPKNFAYSYNERMGKILVVPTYALHIFLAPLRFLITVLVNLVLKVFGVKSDKLDEPFITHEEIECIVTGNDKTVALHLDEQDMIEEVFEFEERSVREIMTPRHEMICIRSDGSFDEVMKIFREHGYSRLPVYKDQVDNIHGVLYIKDFLSFILKNNPNLNFNLENYIRKAYFVPETKKVSELFRDLKQKKLHLAIVVDEYGGTEGLVTMENILEEVVGDIFDEYDVEAEEIDIVNQGEKVWYVSGSTNLSDLEDVIGMDDYFSDEGEIVSVGGLIYSRLGRIPEKSDKLRYKNLEFIIEEMSGNRISKVKVCLS